MKHILSLLAAILSLCTLPCLAVQALENHNLELRGSGLRALEKVPLNDADWSWLRNKGHLVLGVSTPDHRPFDITTSGKHYEGVTADYADLLSQSLDIPFQIVVFPNREKARRALVEGSIDLLASANAFDVQNNSLDLTANYALDQSALYRRLNEKRNFPEYFKGVKIATPNDYLQPDTIREYFPNALIETYKSRHEALAALAFGKADLYLGDSYSANLIINEQYFNYVTIERLLQTSSGGTSFALRKENKKLKRIIDSALKSISSHNNREILRRWGGGSGSSITKPIDLSTNEVNWLRRNPEVKVAVGIDQAPIAFIDQDDNFSGVMSDILKIVTLRTGLKFTARSYNKGSDIATALKNNDAKLAVLSPSVSREATMRFTNPFAVMPFSIVVADSNNDINDLRSLNGYKVAVPSGHILLELLKSTRANIGLIETNNFVETLEYVKSGRADVAIAPLMVSRYYLLHSKDSGLKISGIIGPDKAVFSFAMPRADTELESILNKILRDLPPDELNVINTRWRANSATRESSWIDYQTLILQIAAMVGVLISAAFVWNLKLRRQVRQRQDAEHALSDQLQFMRTLIDGTPLPIYVRDQRGHLLTCNESYTSALHLSKDDVIGKTAIEEGVVAQEDAEHFHADYMQAIRTGEAIVKDRTVILDNQTLHIYHWIQPYRDRHGEVQGVICGWLDISERHQLISDLQAAKKQADDASRAKTTFLATMSHEIRTPMSAVIGMLELALKKRATEGVFDQSTIEVAYNSAKGLLELIGDILDIVRIESGRLNLAPRRTNLRELAESVVRVFDGLARQKGLALTLDFDFEFGAKTDVLVDPVRIKQVISNLISNAIKFTDSGQVQLKIKGTPLPEDRIKLNVVVADTGIGISEEDQVCLFKPFAQASQRVGQIRGGTGLGLTISRSLCEMMGGSLNLTSEPDIGTVVTFDLALSCLPEIDVSPAYTVDENGEVPAPLNVLIVDDHPANLLLLAQQLEFLGHRVTKANNGVDALEHWQKQIYDLIITDCNMPLMSGYALTEAVRLDESRRKLTPCHIFGYTANAQPEEQERCLRAGMNKCLFKPISLEELSLCTSGVTPQKPSPAKEEGPPTAEVFNISSTYQLTRGDKVLAFELLDELVRSNRSDMDDLLRLTENFNLTEIASLAHRIRGAARIVQAEQLIEACSTLEKIVKSQDITPETLNAAVLALQKAVYDVEQAITTLERSPG
ncbi:transporter substrate-binding domain-containing protein [Ectopseudomonas mendocina]|uniref:histidine kinase n=1 Tax=Ectopseudomonas mendocina TaxID=300 RepID=A0ABZ2RJ63_ECTME